MSGCPAGRRGAAVALGTVRLARLAQGLRGADLRGHRRRGVLVLFLWFAAALVFRLRIQFSIHALLVLAVAVALPCSWLAAEMKKARKQKEVVEEINRARGTVAYDWEIVSIKLNNFPAPYSQPQEAAWLRNFLGDEFFGEVVGVSLAGTEVTDARMENLKELTALNELWLNRTKMTGGVRKAQRIDRTPKLGAESDERH